MTYFSRRVPDRIGSQIQDNLSAYAYCCRHDLQYIGSECCFPSTPNEHITICDFLGIPHLYKSNICNKKMLKPDIYRPFTHDGADPNQVFTKEFITMLQKQIYIPNTNDYTVVVHIRRGDVASNNQLRYLPNKHYIDILKKIKSAKPDINIIICSESNFVDDNNVFAALGCNFHINTCILETWKLMISANILIMSKSSFSYVPAIFNKNNVIYTNMWHNKLAHWIDFDDPDLVNKLNILT